MQTTNLTRKMPCASKMRRFWSFIIDFFLLFVIFFIARLIILNDQISDILKNHGLSLDRNHSIGVTQFESLLFMLLDITLPIIIFCIIPTITRGKTIGMWVTRTRVFNLKAIAPGIKMNFVRFSPYIVGLALIAISQTIIDGTRVKMWPSWLINDIDYILSSQVQDRQENIEAIISAVLSTLPFVAGLGIMFNVDARFFSEKWTMTTVVYDGKKIYQSDRNVKLITVIESRSDDEIKIKRG